MASATTDDFLSGRGVPVELHGIETELERLWRPAADEAKGDGDATTRDRPTSPGSSCRISSSWAGIGRGGLEEVLDTVSTRHPSRTIQILRTDDPGRSLSAEISALCHLPAPGLPQVCSERIVLRAGPKASDLVPGAVRPLLESELPFVLWWTNDPRDDEALFRDLGDECTRLILDLPDPGTDPAAVRLGLDPAVCRYARDTAWFGLFRWRELIAQFFDPPVHNETLGRIDSVTIEAVSPRPGPPRDWPSGWRPGSPVNSAGPPRPPERAGDRSRPGSEAPRGGHRRGPHGRRAVPAWRNWLRPS